MKAKFRSGKVISGRLAETFTKIGLTSEIKDEEKPVAKPKVKKEKPVAKPKEDEKNTQYSFINYMPFRVFSEYFGFRKN